MKQFLALFCIVACLYACKPVGDDDDLKGANANQIVKGTITVPDNSYWSSLKMGIFSGGSAGTYTDLDIRDDLQGINYYRVCYINLMDDSDKAIIPVSGTSYSITDTGDIQRPYSFELPATLPPRDAYYYFATWYDTNSDGNLDVKDSFDSSVIAQAEFNRCALKDAFNNDNQPTTLVIWRFEQSRDMNNNLTGKYKYAGYDEGSPPYNEQLELNAANNSGFNFAITNNTGW